MSTRALIRCAGLLFAVTLALLAAGCEATVGVGIGVGYPYGPYGGPWGPYGPGGPVFVGRPIYY